ncbi:MAG: TIGR03862 family flavoprotein [Verrucomicrobia bacterium]|nr:TIGR03862 family flavoprotein [Verrucomicrobiota bacterium]
MPSADADFADLLVVGGGPAGLRAAEVASRAGAGRIVLCDAMPSVGRKFLVAGRGGLNLTHSESVERFPARYGAEPERWTALLARCSPTDLRAWAEGLGVETYIGTSGRVFPRGQQAARLLRAWVSRLRTAGVEFRMKARWTGLERNGERWRVDFADGRQIDAAAVVLALGGASWPETGSDGRWPEVLAAHGVAIAPWQPANCGWECVWPASFLAEAEGQPLKNLAVRAGARTVRGELLITRYGLEGGAIYQLGRELRERPELQLDLKPDLSVDALLARGSDWQRDWKLSPAAAALLEHFGDVRCATAAAASAKALRLDLTGPRPIAEAISSAGGVRWAELDERLMLRRLPGVFVAGEMIDWEAPTGGYLLQGCFATGDAAAHGALEWLALRGGADRARQG